MITLNDYLTSSGRYPKRKDSPECNASVLANAGDLLKRVNALLAELGITKADITSGFRTSEANGQIKNAAKRSAHMTGKAIDIADASGKLKKLVGARPDLLRKHGLMMEDAGSTPTWMHLDTVSRSDRSSRTFRP